MASELQGIDCRITAHEAHDGALHGAVQPAALDDLQVESGRGESGAARDQEVGDVASMVSEGELFDRAGGQDRRMGLKHLHSIRRCWKGTAVIDIVRIDCSVHGILPGLQAGEAMIDATLVGHSPENRAAPVVQLRAGKGEKGRVDVMFRNGRGDAIEVRGGHKISRPTRTGHHASSNY